MNGFPWYFLSTDVSYDPGDDFKFGGQNLMDIPDKEKTVGFVHVLLDKDGVEKQSREMPECIRAEIIHKKDSWPHRGRPGPRAVSEDGVSR